MAHESREDKRPDAAAAEPGDPGEGTVRRGTSLQHAEESTWGPSDSSNVMTSIPAFLNAP